MKVSIKRAIRVQLYVPRGCSYEGLYTMLMDLAGGYTEHPNAVGVWQGPEQLCMEPVRVMDALVGQHFDTVIKRVQVAGEEFLLRNPNEVCFMAYVGGRVLTIEREGETNAS